MVDEAAHSDGMKLHDPLATLSIEDIIPKLTLNHVPNPQALSLLGIPIIPPPVPESTNTAPNRPQRQKIQPQPEPESMGTLRPIVYKLVPKVPYEPKNPTASRWESDEILLPAVINSISLPRIVIHSSSNNPSSPMTSSSTFLRTPNAPRDKARSVFAKQLMVPDEGTHCPNALRLEIPLNGTLVADFDDIVYQEEERSSAESGIVNAAELTLSNPNSGITLLALATHIPELTAKLSSQSTTTDGSSTYSTIKPQTHANDDQVFLEPGKTACLCAAMLPICKATTIALENSEARGGKIITIDITEPFVHSAWHQESDPQSNNVEAAASFCAASLPSFRIADVPASSLEITESAERQGIVGFDEFIAPIQDAREPSLDVAVQQDKDSQGDECGAFFCAASLPSFRAAAATASSSNSVKARALQESNPSDEQVTSTESLTGWFHQQLKSTAEAKPSKKGNDTEQIRAEVETRNRRHDSFSTSEDEAKSNKSAVQRDYKNVISDTQNSSSTATDIAQSPSEMSPTNNVGIPISSPKDQSITRSTGFDVLDSLDIAFTPTLPRFEDSNLANIEQDGSVHLDEELVRYDADDGFAGTFESSTSERCGITKQKPLSDLHLSRTSFNPDPKGIEPLNNLTLFRKPGRKYPSSPPIPAHTSPLSPFPLYTNLMSSRDVAVHGPLLPFNPRIKYPIMPTEKIPKVPTPPMPSLMHDFMRSVAVKEKIEGKWEEKRSLSTRGNSPEKPFVQGAWLDDCDVFLDSEKHVALEPNPVFPNNVPFDQDAMLDYDLCLPDDAEYDENADWDANVVEDENVSDEGGEVADPEYENEHDEDGEVVERKDEECDDPFVRMVLGGLVVTEEDGSSQSGDDDENQEKHDGEDPVWNSKPSSHDGMPKHGNATPTAVEKPFLSLDTEILAMESETDTIESPDQVSMKIKSLRKDVDGRKIDSEEVALPEHHALSDDTGNENTQKDEAAPTDLTTAQSTSYFIPSPPSPTHFSALPQPPVLSAPTTLDLLRDARTHIRWLRGALERARCGLDFEVEALVAEEAAVFKRELHEEYEIRLMRELNDDGVNLRRRIQRLDEQNKGWRHDRIGFEMDGRFDRDEVQFQDERIRELVDLNQMLGDERDGLELEVGENEECIKELYEENASLKKVVERNVALEEEARKKNEEITKLKKQTEKNTFLEEEMKRHGEKMKAFDLKLDWAAKQRKDTFQIIQSLRHRIKHLEGQPGKRESQLENSDVIHLRISIDEPDVNTERIQTTPPPRNAPDSHPSTAVKAIPKPTSRVQYSRQSTASPTPSTTDSCTTTSTTSNKEASQPITTDSIQFSILRVELALTMTVVRRAAYGFQKDDTRIALSAAKEAVRDAQWLLQETCDHEGATGGATELLGRALYWYGIASYYADNLQAALENFVLSTELQWRGEGEERGNLEDWVQMVKWGRGPEKRREAYMKSAESV